MKTLLALLIACLALTVTACGGDDGEDDLQGGGGGGGAATTEQTDTGGGDSGGGDSGGGGEEVVVDIPAITFEPDNVTVEPGTTVRWTNTDDLPHTVTKTGGPGEDFDSGNIEPGGEFEYTFEGSSGTIDYVCTIHPGQEGSVTVE